MNEILAKLVCGQDLSESEAERAVGLIMDGKATAAQMGAFLAALRTKGETVDELVATVRAVRARSVKVKARGPLLDTCGTGGDGRGTFNISTATAFVAAAAGARVAKHGNRAASGKVGAADVLEALGAQIELDAEHAASCLERTGITFLFAPRFHPAFKHVGPVRREIGFRTLFNLTGPLCNPAGADHQLLGLFSPDWLEPCAEALLRLGCKRALVVHGADGSDELSTVGSNRAVELRDATTVHCDIDPAVFGLAPARDEDLRGGDAAANAERIRAILSGRSGPDADAVALNAGAAIYVAGLAEAIADGVCRAQALLAAGDGLAVLEAFVAASRESAG